MRDKRTPKDVCGEASIVIDGLSDTTPCQQSFHFVCLLECRGENEGLPESRQAFEVIEA